jgi:iron complex outermembrane recepter protein
MRKITLVLILSLPLTAISENRESSLEEIMVTAQKREQSIQEVPISVIAFSESDIYSLLITNPSELAGLVPSLSNQGLGNVNESLTLSIRGHAPDPSQVTKAPSVGIYIDGVYMSRAQGMGVDLADPERIEVLRGPQGTLFGRNTVGGAISVISKKPTGEFSLNQTVDIGNYDYLRSVTHLNLPSFGSVNAKIDYIHEERGGFVDNVSGQSDFGERNNDGGRLSLNYNATDTLQFNYAYDNTRTESAQYYFQLHEDNNVAQTIGAEPNRADDVRTPLYLKPTIIKKEGHTLNASWELSSDITLTSITGYHELEQDTNNNYGGTLYFFGLNDAYTIDQKQFSQEVQLIGKTGSLVWVAGLYYFDEDANQDFNTQITQAGPTPVTVDSFSGEVHAKSKAVFGQVTWTPPTFDQLHLTLGGRYTDDDKNGLRTRNPGEDYDFGSHSKDPMIAAQYDFTDDLSVYAKWSSAYKAVGYNLRSITFDPYDREQIKTSEIGLKSELWDNRARINMAAFHSVYKDMQLDFNHPVVITNVETKNAMDRVRISGFEIDAKVTPVAALTLGASYTYLATDKHRQDNPLDTSLSQTFNVTQAPEHAGSLTLDYQASQNINIHLDVISTDSYAHVTFEPLRLDAYTLVNANVTFNVPLQNNNFDLSLWARNLLDEEYITNGFTTPSNTITQVFGDPRTFGIKIAYRL